RKATLRGWRWEFARHLRAQGIAANATERAVRGDGRTHKRDGIYRANARGASTHVQARIATAVDELLRGDLHIDPGRKRLQETRERVVQGWLAMRDILVQEGQPRLAEAAARFADQLPKPRTEKEQLAQAVGSSLLERAKRERLVTR